MFRYDQLVTAVTVRTNKLINTLFIGGYLFHQVEEALDNHTVPKYLETCNEQIGHLVSLVREPLKAGTRITVEALIVLDVHGTILIFLFKRQYHPFSDKFQHVTPSNSWLIRTSRIAVNSIGSHSSATTGVSMMQVCVLYTPCLFRLSGCLLFFQF